LTQVKKKGRDSKNKLIEEARSLCDKFAHVYLLSVQNFRTEKMQEIREEWKPSRFLFGKTTVLALALGKSPETEYKKNLYEISSRLAGNSCLLFTDEPQDKVLTWFDSYTSLDYARGGDPAPETITLDAGPYKQFSHSIEPHMRSLGLPTSLERGVVTLIKDHTVCTEGKPLTSEEASILKLFGIQLAEFKLTVDCVWSNDGKNGGRFEEFVQRPKRKAKSSESVKIGKRKQRDENDDDEMEMDVDAPQMKKKGAAQKKKKATKTKTKKKNQDDMGSDGEGKDDDEKESNEDGQGDTLVKSSSPPKKAGAKKKKGKGKGSKKGK